MLITRLQPPTHAQRTSPRAKTKTKIVRIVMLKNLLDLLFPRKQLQHHKVENMEMGCVVVVGNQMRFYNMNMKAALRIARASILTVIVVVQVRGDTDCCNTLALYLFSTLNWFLLSIWFVEYFIWFCI